MKLFDAHEVLPGQITILESFTTNKIEPIKIKLFECFSGYGSQSLALDMLGIEYEHVGIAEIDKYAIQAHKALHGEVKNYGDVSKLKVEELPDMDLFTYSFPCQDISVAGKGRGLAKESGTRSSLLWECERIIDGKRPTFLMMENVKNLVGKANKPHFDEWLRMLEGFGYNNYWQVVNAKECGIPQNRERVFCVSILKDFDDGSFKFNKPFDNGLRLKHLLETEVDEKYYLNSDLVSYFIQNTIRQQENGNGFKFDPQSGEKHAKALTTRAGGRMDDNFIADENVVLKVKEATKLGYAVAREGDSINLEQPNSKTRRGRVGKECAQTITTSPQQAVVEPNGCIQVGTLDQPGFDQRKRVYSENGCSPTINTMQRGGDEPKVLTQYRIRKLTSKECLRLMGLTDAQIDKIQAAGISNSQQYKMAGNSIVVHQMAFLKNLPGIKRGDL